jgi:serine/threonine-protein kinase
MGSTDEQIDAVWEENGWDEGWKQFASDEQPAHRVEITEGFWLYRHEVTNGQYERFLEATGHAPHDWWDDYREHERLPVNNITWHDSVAYARWADGSLPTEAQWEYAARGPSGRLFPWGDEWDRTKCCSAEYWAERPLNDYDAWKQWYEGIGAYRNEEDTGWKLKTSRVVEHMKPVGSFASGASWCGALDLAGNVYEWCADGYDEDYYGSSPETDPRGPTESARRVLRGGAWYHFADCCRGAYRCGYAPAVRNRGVGCRVARSCR